MNAARRPDTEYRCADTPLPAGHRIRIEAEKRLARSSYSALRDVRCESDQGELRLRGRPASHFVKQVAQAIVAGIDGVHRVVNLIEVVSAEPRPARVPTTSIEGEPSHNRIGPSSTTMNLTAERNLVHLG